MFDKARCINNIYSLAKERGIRIGDLEESAGMSKGYLSRVAKPEYQGSPSIELLDAVSHQLGVGIDFLLNYDPDALSADEQFVMKFIDKLATQTEAGNMEWLYETMATLSAKDNARTDHPSVSPGKEYTSAIYEKKATVSGTCYHAQLPGSKTEVYLNKVTYHCTPRNEKLENYMSDIVEVYLSDGTVQPICSTYYVSEELKNAVDHLYQMISNIPSRIALSPSARSAMNTFLKR